MSEATEKRKKCHITNVTEKFCSKLGNNTVIVTAHTPNGKIVKCLYAEECDHKKECCDKMR